MTCDKKICETCVSFLTSTNNTSNLITLKNRRKLTSSLKDVVKVTSASDKIIKQKNHLIFVKKNIKDFLALKMEFHAASKSWRFIPSQFSLKWRIQRIKLSNYEWSNANSGYDPLDWLNILNIFWLINFLNCLFNAPLFTV